MSRKLEMSSVGQLHAGRNDRATGVVRLVDFRFENDFDKYVTAAYYLTTLTLTLTLTLINT